MRILTCMINILVFISFSWSQTTDSTGTDIPDPEEKDYGYELIEKRTYHSKTFYKPKTKSYRTLIYAGYIHYKTDDDKFQEIDLNVKLKGDSAYYSGKGLYNVTFNKSIDKKNKYDLIYKLPRLVEHSSTQKKSLANKSTEITWKLDGMGYLDSGDLKFSQIEDVNTSKAKILENEIQYLDVLDGIDLEYKISPTELKEYIIISEKSREKLPDPSKYKISDKDAFLVFKINFILTPHKRNIFASLISNREQINLNNKIDFSGIERLEFEDTDGNFLFSWPRGYAWVGTDSIPGEDHTDVFRSIHTEGNKNIMYLGVSWEWLKNSPPGSIIIDPSISIKIQEDVWDTWLENSSNNGSSDIFIVGKCNYYPKKRSVIKFDISAIPAGATINSSKMYVYWFAVHKPSWSTESIITRYVRANRIFTTWSESSATRDYPWNIAYGDFGATGIYDYSNQYEDEVYFDWYDTGACWKSFDLTNATSNWYSGSWSNHGVVLWATNENTVGRTLRFRSSEYSDPDYIPFLEITYERDYTKNYFLKDHLGNIRVTIDDDGEVVGYNDYYPFGLQMPQRNMNSALSSDIYKFSGKELDEENGLDWYYFGARYYDPEIGRFLTVDRFADKYPSLSPYQYAANNPVLFVDVNGDSIWINTGDGNDPLLYTQSMTYEGSNEQVAALINSLNNLNTVNSGNTILTSLTGSTAHYNVQFGGAYVGGYDPNAIQQGSGGSILIGNPTSVSAVGHEFFHAFQHESMNMPNSTAFEVGAHLFESHIYSELNKGMVPLGPEGGSQQFSNAFQNLLYNNNFNQQDFNTATNRFLNSSFNPGGPQNGPYSHLRPIIINNPVIRRFYPLVRGF